MNYGEIGRVVFLFGVVAPLVCMVGNLFWAVWISNRRINRMKAKYQKGGKS